MPKRTYKQPSFTRPPDMVGTTGKAWRITMPPVGQRSRPDEDATLGAWLINDESLNPFWSWWLLTTIHLRPIPNVRPATIRVPGATHELICLSLNPESYAELDPDKKVQALNYLLPADLEHQIVDFNDERAIILLDIVVWAVTVKHMPPDHPMLHDMLPGTVAHIRSGAHDRH